MALIITGIIVLITSLFGAPEAVSEAVSETLSQTVKHTINPVNTTIGHPITYTITWPQTLTTEQLSDLKTQLPADLSLVVDSQKNPVMTITITPQTIGTIRMPALTVSDANDVPLWKVPEQAVTITPLTQPFSPVAKVVEPHQFITVEQPLWLLACLLILLLRRRRQYVDLRADQAYLITGYSCQYMAPWAIRIGLVCMSLALADPVRYVGTPQTDLQGYDVMLVIDTSLKTDDLGVAGRLAAIHKGLDTLLQKPYINHAGIIALNSQPYTHMPLTSDHSLVKQAVSQLVYTHDSDQNSAKIEDALAMAAYRLRSSVRHNNNQSRIILFSSGTADKATIAIPTIPVDVIGLGGTRGTALVIDKPSYTKRYKRDASNRIQYIYRQDKQLQAIAQQGYYFTAPTAASLATISRSLHMLYPPQQHTHYATDRQSYGRWSAGLGIVLIISGLLLRIRRL